MTTQVTHPVSKMPLTNDYEGLEVTLDLSKADADVNSVIMADDQFMHDLVAALMEDQHTLTLHLTHNTIQKGNIL